MDWGIIFFSKAVQKVFTFITKAYKSVKDGNLTDGLELLGEILDDSVRKETEQPATVLQDQAQLEIITSAFALAMVRYAQAQDRLDFWCPEVQQRVQSRFRIAEGDLENFRLTSSAPQVDLRLEVGSPLLNSHYEQLWLTFTNIFLEEDVPLIDISELGSRRRFESCFMYAYRDILASPSGKYFFQRQLHMCDDQRDLILQTLLIDMTNWGRRHVFGDNINQKSTNIIPFLPLDKIYIEPFGRLSTVTGSIDGDGSNEYPIKELVNKLLKEHVLVVVKGHFGHGKSLTARSFAKDLALQWFQEQDRLGLEILMPVFINCSRCIIGPNYDHQEVIRNALSQQALCAELTHQLDLRSEAFLGPHASQASCYIFDGLDEVSLNSSDLRLFFQKLRLELGHKKKAVIFTRPGALYSEADTLGQFETPVVELLSFKPSQQERWIEAWKQCENDSDSKLSLEAIRDQGLGELAEVPILLLMMAMTFHMPEKSSESTKKHQQAEKTDLYERFFRHIAKGKYTEADKNEHAPIRDASDRLKYHLGRLGVIGCDGDSVEAMLWLLSRVAWMAHELVYDKESRHLTRDEILVGILGQELSIRQEDYLNAIQVGLILTLQLDPHGTSREILFGHKSFREFLVARYWATGLRKIIEWSHELHTHKIADQEEIFQKSRLLQTDDEAFSMLKELLETWSESDKDVVYKWASRVINDDRLSGQMIHLNKRALLQESALAIGSAIRPMSFNKKNTLRSIISYYDVSGQKFRLNAPGLKHPKGNLFCASLEFAELEGADLSENYMEGVRLGGADLRGGNLAGARLVRATFFPGCRAGFAGVVWWHNSISSKKVNSLEEAAANLNEANLQEAQLYGANLIYAQLSSANLYKASLDHADLGWANLAKANLAEAKMKRANLSRANLANANLKGADLEYATLNEANLSGTDLSEAILKDVKIDGIIYDAFTTWPEGFKPSN